MTYDIIIRLVLSAAALGGMYLSLRLGLLRFKPLLSASCLQVVDSPYSKLMGISFWWGGIAAYVIILLAAATSQGWIVLAGFLVSVLALLASFYLTIIMVAKLRANCRLCWMANILNVAIFIIWVIIAQHA